MKVIDGVQMNHDYYVMVEICSMGQTPGSAYIVYDRFKRLPVRYKKKFLEYLYDRVSRVSLEDAEQIRNNNRDNMIRTLDGKCWLYLEYLFN